MWPTAGLARTDEVVEEIRQTCTGLTGSRICIRETSYTADVCRAIASFAAYW